MITTLFEPKADIEFQLSEMHLHPGATVPVELIIYPQEQLSPKEIRLELVGTESYFVTKQSGRHAVLVRKLNQFTRLPYIIKKLPSFTPYVMSSCKVNIQVPVDAPPSCRGKNVYVDWTLKAIIKLPRRMNMVHEMPIQVLSNSVSARKDMSFSPYEKTYKNCKLGLEVPGINAAKGVVSGHLQVKAIIEFQVRSIRMELRQIEDVTGIEKISHIVAQQQLSGPAFFNAGDPASFAFTIPLPPDAPPTVATPNSSLRWQLKAILDRQKRKDFCIEQDVYIFNTDDPPKQ